MMSPFLWALIVCAIAAAGAAGVLVGKMMAGVHVTLKDAIGMLLIIAFVGALFILFWKAIPPANEQLIVYMLGQLSGFVAGVVSSHYVHKAGEDKLAAQRQDTVKAQAEATKAVADALAGGGDKAATGKPGDPVHTKEEQA